MGRTTPVTPFLVALVAFLALPSPARATEQPSVDMRTWRPSTDPNASLVLEPAATPGPGALSFGAYGAYALRPVSLHAPGSGTLLRPVEDSLGVDLLANLGIGQRFAVGVALPVFLYQTGSGGLPPSVSQHPSVPSAGLGDLGVSLKAALIRNEHGGFGLAALGYGTAPTGDRDSFLSEHAVTGTVRLLAEYTILIATFEASLGYTARAEHHTWPDDDAAGVRFGNEVPWSVGLGVRPAAMGIDPGNRQRIELAFHGGIGGARLSPALFTLSDRVELGHDRDTYVTVGGEVGLDDAFGVPTVRAVLGFGWTPRSHDRDHDGVTDDLDACPDLPGGKDGCPS